MKKRRLKSGLLKTLKKTPLIAAVFQIKQILLDVKPAAKANQAPVMADYPVTGNDDDDRD